MPKYQVAVTYSVREYFIVEAATEEEACAMVNNQEGEIEFDDANLDSACYSGAEVVEELE